MALLTKLPLLYNDEGGQRFQTLGREVLEVLVQGSDLFGRGIPRKAGG